MKRLLVDSGPNSFETLESPSVRQIADGLSLIEHFVPLSNYDCANSACSHGHHAAGTARAVHGTRC